MRLPHLSCLSMVCAAFAACSSAPVAENPAAGNGPLALLAAPAPALAGAYLLTTRLDPVTAGLLGKKTAAGLSLIGDLEQHPGRTLLAAAELSGAGVVTDLRKLLPDSLESKLADWLDEAILGQTGGGFAGLSAQVEALRTMAEVLELQSELTPQLPTAAQHRPIALRFAAAGQTLQIPLPAALVGSVPAATLSLALLQADATAKTPPRLALGPHRFGVPLGTMLLQAAGPLVFRPLGGETLADVLLSRANCPAVGQKLGEKCLAGLCLGRLAGPERLEKLCDHGVRALAEQVSRRIAGQDAEILDFASGEATLAQRGLGDGRWRLRVQAGEVQVDSPATFSGIARPGP
jgi:hypothetical protein